MSVSQLGDLASIQPRLWGTKTLDGHGNHTALVIFSTLLSRNLTSILAFKILEWLAV